MNMKKIFAVPLLLMLAPGANAVPCTTSVSLGILGPPGLSLLGNSFTAEGAFTDCYTFSLNGAADLTGFVDLQDPLSRLEIDLTLSLYEGGVILDSTTGNQTGTSFGPGSFAFSSLAAGLYSLVADGGVTRGNFGLPLPVGYFGVATSYQAIPSPADPAPTSVPEPGTWVLLLAGLAGICLVKRRRVN